ncbi:hypothetical protein BV898_10167 [Hypsibius exemplaris]|uniref:Orcokinin peptides type A n=1 Tax=Hypsibius exemplaris TaxID=2072580 RepID=A0A1W0WKJ2_HYPEX|nr:hypothetical protein BV898_10167 [Hypsibius exemplaris]
MTSAKVALHSAMVILVILPAVIICKAIPEETANVRETRAFDSLVGGGLGRDLSHTIRKLPTRSRMDTLTGFGLGRSFDNDYVLYQYPPWMAARPYEPTAGEMTKRSLDMIDSAGFGQFTKRNFDQLDSAGFGSFSKRNFDQMDRPGMHGFGNFMGKRNFDTLDRAGFGTFSRRR